MHFNSLTKFLSEIRRHSVEVLYRCQNHYILRGMGCFVTNHLMKIHWFLAFLFVAVQSHAEINACDIDRTFDACEKFKPTDPLIAYEDPKNPDIFIPNMARAIHLERIEAAQSVVRSNIDLNRTIKELKAERNELYFGLFGLVSAARKVAGEPESDSFVEYLLSAFDKIKLTRNYPSRNQNALNEESISIVEAIVESLENPNDFNPLLTVPILWPPTDVDPKKQNVSLLLVQEYLRNLFQSNSSISVSLNASAQRSLLSQFLVSAKSYINAYRKHEKAIPSEVSELDKIKQRVADLTVKKRARMDTLFADAKKFALQLLNEKLQSMPNNSDLEVLIQKVTDIDYKHPESTGSSRVGYNASYNPLTNEIQGKPGLYNLPDEFVIYVLGHEIGHALDTCGADSNAYAINATKLRDYAEAVLAPRISTALSAEEADGETYSESLSFKQIIGLVKYIEAKKVSSTNSKLFLSEQYLAELTPKVAEEILASEGIKSTGQQILNFQSGNPDEPLTPHYPFYSAFQCLKQNHPSLVASPGRNELNLVIDKAISNLNAAFNIPETQAAVLRERFLNQITPKLFCISNSELGLETYSKHGESIADVIGIEIMARFIQSKGQNYRPDPLVVFGPKLSVACYEKFERQRALHAPIVGEGFLQSTQKMIDGEHPFSLPRIRDLMMSHPVLTTRFGCAADPGYCSAN